MSSPIPYLLSLITFLPLIGAIVILILDGDQLKKQAAFWTTIVTFAVSLLLWFNWDNSQAGMQFVENVAWSPELGLRYHMGVDGISLFLVLLTTLLMPIVVYFSNQHVTENVGAYLVLMLLLQTAMIGVFLALDLILFFVFFEFSFGIIFALSFACCVYLFGVSYDIRLGSVGIGLGLVELIKKNDKFFKNK